MRKLAHARPKTLLGNPRVTWPDNPEIASSFFYKGSCAKGSMAKKSGIQLWLAHSLLMLTLSCLPPLGGKHDSITKKSDFRKSSNGRSTISRDYVLYVGCAASGSTSLQSHSCLVQAQCTSIACLKKLEGMGCMIQDRP